MGIYVFPQPVGRPPYISGPTNRNIVFIRWEHTITAAEEGYMELWTPFVNGQPQPHHAMIHMATVSLSMDLKGSKQIRVFMQSPDETIRTLIPTPIGAVLPQEGIYSLRCPFIAVHESRGVLTLDEAPEGLVASITYQLELI